MQYYTSGTHQWSLTVQYYEFFIMQYYTSDTHLGYHTVQYYGHNTCMILNEWKSIEQITDIWPRCMQEYVTACFQYAARYQLSWTFFHVTISIWEMYPHINFIRQSVGWNTIEMTKDQFHCLLLRYHVNMFKCEI